jgi:replicative DNA helicase/5S rRNA maturation endonuclease (ribonuclease M5)
LDNFELLKQKVNIMDVIQEDVTLKRSGKVWKSQCPFHQDKTPSFTVYPQTKSFHCFGCDESGTVIDYFMKREAIKEPHEALERMADRYNVQLVGHDPEKFKQRKEKIRHNRRTATDYYKNYMLANKYIKERGISQAIAQKFGLGFDSESNAISIPFLNAYGEVVGISKRFLDGDGPKYKNSEESDVFKKSELLYGLNHCRKSINERIFIVEGYFDVMALHEMGISEVVAYCGQSITDEQVHLLSKYITKHTKIYLIPDNDLTGKKAVSKNIAAFRSRLKNHIGVIELPQENKDANDLLLSGKKLDEIKSQHFEMFLLKQELEICLDREDEYEVAKTFSKKTQNKMLKAEMADFLSKRWNKPITLVREHMEAEVTTTDYIGDMYGFMESMNAYREFVEKGDEGKVFSGLKGVDNLIKGMRPGEVCTLLGRSGAGKTTFILNLMYNMIVKQGRNVIFNSLELNRVNIVPQFIQIHKKLPEGRVARLVQSGEVDTELMELSQKLENHLKIVDRGGQTLFDVEMYAKIANDSIFDTQVDVIFVDYFQYLKTKGKGNHYEEMSNMAREMKELAKRLNCVLVVLTQANREGGGDGSEKLSMKSARDTGAIEESSDYMLGVYRPAANPKLTEDEKQSVQHEMYCQVLKNRWGATGEIKVHFEGMTKRITDWRD